jgi:hypothetical protein
MFVFIFVESREFSPNPEFCIGIVTDNNELTGTVPTELGLLTRLTTLHLRTFCVMFVFCIFVESREFSPNPDFCIDMITGSNRLTGTVPTELGLLTKLTTAFLGTFCVMFVFCIFVARREFSPNPDFCINIVTDINDLTGKVPTELGLLTKLAILCFGTFCVVLVFCIFVGSREFSPNPDFALI